MSEVLSQKEIDELLNKQKSNGDSTFTEVEVDTLGEIGNISMGAAATALYELIGKRVDITTPGVTVTDMERLASEYTVPFVLVEVKFTAGVEGRNILVMKHEDVMILTDLLMGGDGTSIEGELDEIRLSAMGEIMNQMIGSSSTSLSTILDKMVNIEPPKVFEAKFDNFLSVEKDETLVKVSFKMEIEDLVNSEIMQIMPLKFAKKLVNSLLNGEEEEAENQPENTVEEKKIDVHNELKKENKSREPISEQVKVKPLNLPSFDEKTNNVKKHDRENMDILMDVPLPITVELGKSKKMIKEILELNEGSIVVLDKLAGDLVDIVVNGKLLAKGEVVIIDDNYGVRITELADYSKSDLR